MARPIGSFESSHKPGSGRKETTGHSSGRQALARGEPLRGLALKAQQSALERYEVDGVYELAVENASRVQAVADCFWSALLGEQSKDEPNPKTVVDLSIRLVGYLTKATQAWIECGELRKAKDAKVVDYEQVLERERDE
jgi:hypothetical protein